MRGSFQIAIGLFLAVFVSTLKAQDNYIKSGLNTTPCLTGLVISPEVEAELATIPFLSLSTASTQLALPIGVDNSKKPWFRGIFTQVDGCCGQAAGIGYTFTYEVNRVRNLNANNSHNQYPTHFTYNYVNETHAKRGSWPHHGWEVIKEMGVPSVEDYGGMYKNIDTLDRINVWETGYNHYYNALANKTILSYMKDSICDTIGLYNLKHWLFDHGNGESSGGVAVFCANVFYYNSDILPAESDSTGQWIVTGWGNNEEGLHAMTIVGYNDNIVYDFNGDGLFTNEGDLANWERGAFIVANSWGTGALNHGLTHNNGFLYVPYRLITGFHDREVYYLTVADAYTPELVLRAKVKHPSRLRLWFYAGYASNSSQAGMVDSSSFKALNWDKLNIPEFRNLAMQGLQGNNDPIELGLDFGQFFPEQLHNNEIGKFFFVVRERLDANGMCDGEIRDLSLLDYRWGEIFEMPYQGNSVEPLVNNGYTRLGIKYHLVPFENAIETNFTMATDRVARRTVTVSGGTFSIGNGVKLDMYGTDDYDCELLFGSNASLVIGDSAVITAKRGDCRIEINGNVQIGQNVRFEAEDGASLEIIIDNGSDVSFYKTTFVNCELALPEKNVSLNTCHFLGTPVSIERNATGGNNTTTATVSCCIFKPNGKSIAKALYIKGYAQYSVENCIISNVDPTGGFADGIYVHSSGTGNTKTISGNEITNCTGAGLIMYASAGNITMNRIYDNGYGVRLLNNSNIGQFSGDCSADLAIKTQYIHDNAGREVYMTGGCIPQTFRYNSIGDDDNVPFVYYDALIGFVYPSQRVSIDVAYNHWSPNFDSNTHLVTNSNLWYYVSSPQWVLGDCGPKTSNAENMIASADSLVSIGNHVSAKALYKQVIADYPTTVSAETALKSLLMIERYADNDYEGLKEYYQTHPAILGDESLSHMAFSLSNKCDEILENYEEAIAWYEGVLTDPETGFNDSIFAAIDLGDLYLRMEENGSKGVIGKLIQYVPESVIAHQKQTQIALSLLPKIEGLNGFKIESEVFINYDKEALNDLFTLSPNPADGTVLISGENLSKIEIFDILGKKVYEQQNNETISVNVASWKKGLYLISITEKRGSVVNKILLVR